jgi:O-acetyl-ADP-ribose deacetylase (regulator of RNase III)
MPERSYRIGQSVLRLRFGDLTTSKADVLVSSIDTDLIGAAGVAAALKRAGGEVIALDSAKAIPASVGDVVITTAGTLPARHIFHAITLGATDLEPREIIRRTTRRCMELLLALELRSIAFPAIGTGVAGFKLQDAAIEMTNEIANHLKSVERSLDVTIYLFQHVGGQPLNFIGFFEEFAVHARQLIDEDLGKAVHEKPSAEVSHEGHENETDVETLVRLRQELGRLGHERDALERRLVELRGGLSPDEINTIAQRLQEIHQARLEVLSQLDKGPEHSVSCFVSYSHEDEELRVELGKHLRALERSGLIGIWHDRKIVAGSDWNDAISQQLTSADVMLVLVSADFVSSDYCYDVEMKQMLKRHKHGDALMIPIILRPTNLEGTPFAGLQALPRDANPVTVWQDRDAALVNVTEGIAQAVRDFLTRGV